MSLTLTLNGENRHFPLSSGAPMTAVLEELALQLDRIAVELNGTIVPRTTWTTTCVAEGDRLEVVHFVGGGTSNHAFARTRCSSSSSHRRP